MTGSDEERLRKCMAVPLVEPVTAGDGHFFHPEAALRPAAVLVPVVSRAEGLSVMFTRRTAHLSDHAGQISFPGGRSEPADDSPAATALREAEEEVGLSRMHVEILGYLHEYTTVTRYRVTPVVGLVSPSAVLKPDASEVAEVFEVPLAFLLDPGNRQLNSVTHLGRIRRYWAFPWRTYYIWGATAGMLMNFSAQLGLSSP